MNIKEGEEFLGLKYKTGRRLTGSKLATDKFILEIKRFLNFRGVKQSGKGMYISLRLIWVHLWQAK